MRRKLHPVMIKLLELLKDPDLESRFISAMNSIKRYNLEEFSTISTLSDWILNCNDFLTWIPVGESQRNNLEKQLTIFWFFFYQPSMRTTERESVIQEWLHEYTEALKEFYDSTASINAASLKSFYNSPAYNMEQYVEDPSGWRTFNQFFARHIKPGYRPVYEPSNNKFIVSAADSVFKGAWSIDEKLEIKVKGIAWSISELLHENPYAHHYKNGVFMHAYLDTTDYHRYHAPMAGTVRHSEVVQGNLFLETYVSKGRLKSRRAKDEVITVDSVGYQFTQTRGVVVIETEFGFITMIPVGMSFVSSVILTAEKYCVLNKGDEVGYFQFGASDYILLFPESMGVVFMAKVGTHYNQGEPVGYLSI